jgi:hypothetical protein
MTSFRLTAAVFAIFIGASILLMWSVFLISGQVPELDTKPVETALHMTAEFLTALALIGAGAGQLTGQSWGRQAYLVSMGMLLYSVIQSAGYFAQTGQFTFIGMFAVFALLAVVFTILTIFDEAAPEDMTRLLRRRRVY